MHLASSSLLAGYRSAFACAPVCPPYPCTLLSRQCRCYLITAADQREAESLEEECSAAYLGPAATAAAAIIIYLSLSLLLPCGWALLLFRRLSCCCACLLLYYYYYYCHTYLILALLLSLLCFPSTHPPTHTPPSTLSSPFSLRADKVPRSHSTALAPCIGPARVNTAQSALDPDPLAFCSASRPLLHHQPTLRP